MTKAKNWALAILFVVFASGSIVSVVAPIAVSAQAYKLVPTCAKPILTFPVWYRGLVGDPPACNLKSPDSLNTNPAGQPSNGLSNFIWRIVLNVTEIALQLVGYIAVGFILYGGFQFLTSQGSAEGSVKARKTILNAVIGLVISIASIAIVNLIVKVIQ